MGEGGGLANDLGNLLGGGLVVYLAVVFGRAWRDERRARSDLGTIHAHRRARSALSRANHRRRRHTRRLT